MSSAIDTTPVDTEKSGSARGAIAWAVVLILVAVYCLQFGLQTLLWIESRQWAASNPPLAEIPQPLPAPASPPTTPAAASKGTVLKAYDYQFRVPWTGKWKQTPPMATTEFRFDSGQIVLMFDPDTQKEVLRGIRTSKSQDYLNFADVLAGQNVDSDYALFSAVYGSSPAQISPFMHQSDAQRVDLLVVEAFLRSGCPAGNLLVQLRRKPRLSVRHSGPGAPRGTARIRRSREAASIDLHDRCRFRRTIHAR